jgi:RimJ/RimL family protein N-acetyltransferase
MTASDYNELPLFGDYYMTPYSLEDAKAVYDAFTNIEITANLAGPRTDPYTIDDAIQFITDHGSKTYKDTTVHTCWAIRDRSRENALIGSIDIRPSDMVEGMREHLPDPELKERFALFGFWLSPDYRRQGVMSAALRCLVEEVGVKIQGIHHFYGNCFAGNMASRKTFENVGFKMVKYVKDGGIKWVPYQVRDLEMFELIK